MYFSIDLIHLLYKLKLYMIKNGCKIIREAGQTQSWPINSFSRSNNIVAPDFEMPCTAKSCNRHNGMQG